MPFWNFFAFDSNSIAAAILKPVQDAIRKRDLPHWQKVFDQLSKTHAAPRVLHGRYSPNITTLAGLVAPKDALSWESIPKESDFELRRTLRCSLSKSLTIACRA